MLCVEFFSLVEQELDHERLVVTSYAKGPLLFGHC